MLFRKANPRLATLLLFTLVSVSRTVGAQDEPSKPRGEIRVVESFRPDINVLGHNVLQYLFEYALDRNELTPSLAVSRKWVNDTTLEIELRQGVRFHNGEPFDAHAVKFNFEYQRKHNPGRGVQVYMSNVEEIRAIGPHTIRMLLNEPDSLLLDKTIIGPVAGWVIGAPKYMEKVGWQEFLKRPIGTGPYMVEGEVKDYTQVPEGEVYARLVANPDYRDKGRPKIQRVIFVHYSPQNALQAVIEGRVDLVTSLIPKDVWKVEESPQSKVVKGTDDVSFTVGFLNLRSQHTKPLHDIRVRKALNYAINKKELMRYAFKGNAKEMRGILTETSGVDLSAAETYYWDVPKARDLLKEAGHENGFKMTLYYQEKNFLIAKFLQRFYSLLNIDVEIISVDWEWIVKHVVYPNTQEGYSWKDQDWSIIIFSQPGMVPEVMGGQLEWAFHFCAPWQTVPDTLLEPLDRMYHQVRKTRERKTRFEIYNQANNFVAAQSLWLFTMAPISLYGVNQNLNFVPQVSQYLYLDYSSVTESHWSLKD